MNSSLGKLKSSLASLFIILGGQYSLAQYCTAVGPSSTIDSNIESAVIIGDGGTFISYTGCPGVIGLDDQTNNQSVDLSAGSVYSLDVQFGTCGNNFAGSGEAWIDFDGSNTFDPGESLGTWTGTPPTAISNFVFNVPLGCVNGTVRLRMIQAENTTPPIDPCLSYTWGSTVDFDIVLSGGSGGSVDDYCQSVGPSSAADSNLQGLDISGENSTSISFVGCPGVVGFDDQTLNHSVELAKGASYSINALYGTCGGSFAGAATVWIDFDQDGDYETNEIVGTWTGTPPANELHNFTVPLTAVDGATRMRVVQQESGTLPIAPCATFTWGSTTDFTVVIAGMIDCSGYVGDDMTDPRIVSTLPFTETYDNSVCYTNNVPVYNSSDVFYRITPQDYGVSDLNVSLCGSLIDTYLQILDTGGNVLYSNDDYAPCAPQSELSFPVGTHDTLYVVVQGWNNEEGQYDIAINDGAMSAIGNSSDQLEIYPNPASDFIRITGLNESTSIQVFNTHGQLCLEQTIFNNEEIDISKLSPGAYMIQITSSSKLMNHKLIVK